MWCYIMLYFVIWCYIMLYYVLFCYIMLYDVILCCIMLYVRLFYIISYYIIIILYWFGQGCRAPKNKGSTMWWRMFSPAFLSQQLSESRWSWKGRLAGWHFGTPAMTLISSPHGEALSAWRLVTWDTSWASGDCDAQYQQILAMCHLRKHMHKV
jgi:hypothetical protein